MRSALGMLCAAVISACAQRPAVSNEDSIVRAGDVVLRYNGEALTSSRHFYRRVLDSRPGSVARLELLRDGAVQAIELPVEQIETAPRV